MNAGLRTPPAAADARAVALDGLGEAGRKTIADFGDQWTRFDNTGDYLGSQQNLGDQLEPFLTPADLVGLSIADVGAGLGRVSLQLARAGAAEVTAIEPSDAYLRLVDNTAEFHGRIRCVRADAQSLPQDNFDLLVCLGVLHHIPDAKSALRAFFAAVRPGGQVLIWVYGREGNGLYLALAQKLRVVTHLLPPLVLSGVTWAIYPFLRAYMALAHYLQVPLRAYCRNVLARLSPAHIRLTIYDQLNPMWAHYYRREEISDLVRQSGFVEVESAAKHGYSWLVLARRPA